MGQGAEEGGFRKKRLFLTLSWYDFKKKEKKKKEIQKIFNCISIFLWNFFSEVKNFKILANFQKY
jgi:hypothetical protein